MSVSVKYTSFVNTEGLAKRIQKAARDEDFKLQMYEEYARMCDPYVPMQEGMLSQSVEVTSEGLTYTAPYAHYQYIGIVYAPNYPIVKNGAVVRWYSPPGKGTKHATERRLSYSTEMHPLATREWDKAMLRDHRDEFTQIIRNLLVDYYNKNYSFKSKIKRLFK